MITNITELMAALAAAGGGDTIELAPGGYGSADFDGFTFTDYVTITSADGNQGAVFRHITVDNSSFIHIDGIEVDNGVFGSTRGITVQDSNHIKITDNYVHDVGAGYVFLRSTDVIVSENIVDRVGSDGFKVAGLDKFLFENNTHLGTTVQNEGGHMDFIQFSGTASNGVIRGNMFLAQNAANVQGIFIKGATYKNILIEQNIIYTGMVQGIRVHDSNGNNSNMWAKNNTVLNVPDTVHNASVIAVAGAGSGTENNIQSTSEFNAGLDGTGGFSLQHKDSSKEFHYSKFFANATVWLGGATLEDFRPVEGTLAETTGAYIRTAELLDGSPPPPPDPTPDPTPTPEPEMDQLEITSATLDDPAMGSVLIVGTVGVDQRLRVVSDPTWIQNITGTYTVKDLAGQEASTTFIQAVTNPAPVATADTFLVPIMAGDTVDLDFLMNDTA